MHHRAVFPPGTVVAGKYRVERELGVGGMGAVYVAVNEVLRKRVALKVMSRLLDAQPHGVERFFLEAMTASRVRHPAIVEIYDAGRTDDGAPWMAMELLDGESLRGRLERGPLSLGEVLPIFLPLLDALGAVHQQGIVHRDLKPDNIFLERLPGGSLQPKLLDFGIAKNAHAIEKLTRAGSVMGTPDYLAPEQARDSSAVDSRTDLYAMGVVLYVALSGRVPFEATTLPELLLKLVTEDPKPLLAVAPMVPADLANIVHWCLARDPDARPQRAVDLSHHLGRVLEGIPSAAPGNAAAALARARTAPSGARQRGDVGHLGIAPTRSVLPASEPPSFGPPPRPRVAPTQPMDGAGPVDRPATAASSAPAHSSGPESPRRKSHAGLLLGLAGVAVLVVGCVFVAPLVVSLLIGVASVGIAAGGAGGGQAWSPVSTRRFWDSWRMPFIVDVDGDGADDVIGWSRRIVGTDMHSELCAFRGADGEVIWCADVGERDDLSEEETVLLGDRIVHFDARGQISAFGLRDGESLGWQSSVRGEPEEVCALEPGVLAVRTPDRLWSTVSARDGRAVLLGEQAPGTCTPPPHHTSPPMTLGARITSPTWRTVGLREHRTLRIEGVAVAGAMESSDGSRWLIVGRTQGGGRDRGLLMLRAGETELWRAIVPSDPLRAQAQGPEAVAVSGDAAYVVYEMTARGEAPRRMAAFSLADGSRRWDVRLSARGRRAWYVVAGHDLVAMSAGEVLLVLDQRTGERRFQLGEAARR